MLKLNTLARSLQALAAGLVLACALPVAAQTYQVANSTAGSQVAAAPINQIVANLNNGINNAQWTATAANNQANYAVAVGSNAQNTANYAAGTAADAWNRANNAQAWANLAESHAQHTYWKTRDTWLNYCYITTGNAFACNINVGILFPGM